MDNILEDLSTAKWNFITLAFSIFSYFKLSSSSDAFVKKFGDTVHVSNLFVKGYLGATFEILALILITIALFCVTIFIAWHCLSITSIIQTIISICFIYLTFCLGAVPFFGTLLLLIIIAVLLMFLANNY